MILFFISFSLSPATRHSTLATPPFSLYHPVRPVQQRLRNRHADLFRRFEIDHQLELRRLFEGNVSRLGALENFIDEDRSAAKWFTAVCAVGHQAAVVGPIQLGVNGWEALPFRQLQDFL